MRRPRPIWAKLFAPAPSLVLGVLCLVLSVAVHAETLIVALGASNVAGKGVSSAQAWPAQLEGMLRAKGNDAYIKNAGKSGDTTAGMLHRLTFAVP
jgi:acyl-CoA thioesterase I